MTKLSTALAGLKAAQEEAVAAARYEIKQGLQDAFNDPSVENVVFGVSTDPYNDENTGQGVYGPVVNASLSLDADTGELLDFTRDDEYELFYDYSKSDQRTANLNRVLSEAGWKLAGEALGVPYYESEASGHTCAFIAVRRDGGYSLEEHSVGR